MQKLLNAFYWTRKGVTTFLAYVSLRIYGSEVKWSSLWNEVFPSSAHSDLNCDKAQDLPTLLIVATEALHGAEARRAVITDKCKTLLTLSSLLLAVIGILLPKTLLSNPIWIKVAFFVSGLCLLNAILMLLVFFGVGREMVVTLDQKEVELPNDDLKKNLINLHLRCQVEMDNRTDYLVEVYKAARFFFLSAFSFVAVIFFATFLTRQEDPTARIVRELRGDPKLIELLRGPRGEKGERGEKTAVDTKQIVDDVLNDPRLKALKPTPQP